jgi:hypothetical protein
MPQHDSLSPGCMTKFFTFLVGQSCCSALKSWAARQRRPTKDAKIFVMHPFSPRPYRPLGTRRRLAGGLTDQVTGFGVTAWQKNNGRTLIWRLISL